MDSVHNFNDFPSRYTGSVRTFKIKIMIKIRIKSRTFIEVSLPLFDKLLHQGSIKWKRGWNLTD